ncbi:MAG TPA: hypothetical protein DIT66_04340 [Rhodobiaceae bacterium]|nr:MAG: Chaperone SurA [Rhodobiaceae bacterium UBA7378]HCQ82031.1 hypothetical protein [Rhodobiaceae bacterium]
MDNSGEDNLSRRILMAGALAGLLIALIASTQIERASLEQTGAIARINDAHIDRTEYATALQALLADKTKSPTSKDRRLVLDRLIEEELLVQRGIEIGLLDGDAAVRKAVARAVIDFAMTRNAQKQISEDELRSFYAANKARFTPAARLQIERLFVRRSDDAAADMARLDSVRAALRQGQDFTEATLQLGDAILPPLPRSLLPRKKMYDYLGPRLTETASRLPGASISDAIADGDGWHFLRVVRSEPGIPPEFEDIRPQILNAIQRASDDAALIEYLTWLKERASISLADDAPR